MSDDDVREEIARAIADDMAKRNGWPWAGEKFLFHATPIADAILPILARREQEAWERGFMYSFGLERGHDSHDLPVPDYLADDLREWNPHRRTDENGARDA